MMKRGPLFHKEGVLVGSVIGMARMEKGVKGLKYLRGSEHGGVIL